MAKRNSQIIFEGLFERDVLGIFKIMRGFADLRDLAKVSTPYLMDASPIPGQVVGHQRQIDAEHAQRIKNYLESSDNRFLPEIILSARLDFQEEMEGVNSVGVLYDSGNGIRIERRWKQKGNQVHRITIEEATIPEIIEQRLIRRIDGNHRLSITDELTSDEMVPRKYLAPFCIVLLGSTEDEVDDYAESLIFHTINSTALPLESEHALQLILGQNPINATISDKEFRTNPVLHFTRLLRDKIQNLPAPARDRLGLRPLTSLSATARTLVMEMPEVLNDLTVLNRCADDIFAGLNDILPRLYAVHSWLCRAEYFLDLSIRVWNNHKDLEHNQRVDNTCSELLALGDWLKKNHLTELAPSEIWSEQLLKIYKAIQRQVPKRVFLARWYPSESDGINLKKAELRVDAIKRALQQFNLELIDLGKPEGGTYDIYPRMYGSIETSDIILIDLTGIRPNVCIEAGYALRHHETNRLIFLHQSGCEDIGVPFDLRGFFYVEFNDTGEIEDSLRTHLSAILEQTGTEVQ